MNRTHSSFYFPSSIHFTNAFSLPFTSHPIGGSSPNLASEASWTTNPKVRDISIQTARMISLSLCDVRANAARHQYIISGLTGGFGTDNGSEDEGGISGRRMSRKLANIGCKLSKVHAHGGKSSMDWVTGAVVER